MTPIHIRRARLALLACGCAVLPLAAPAQELSPKVAWGCLSQMVRPAGGSLSTSRTRIEGDTTVFADVMLPTDGSLAQMLSLSVGGLSRQGALGLGERASGDLSLTVGAVDYTCRTNDAMPQPVDLPLQGRLGGMLVTLTAADLPPAGAVLNGTARLTGFRAGGRMPLLAAPEPGGIARDLRLSELAVSPSILALMGAAAFGDEPVSAEVGPKAVAQVRRDVDQGGDRDAPPCNLADDLGRIRGRVAAGLGAQTIWSRRSSCARMTASS